MQRFLLSLFIGLVFSYWSFAQVSLKNFVFDSQNRQYRIYVPPSYNGTSPIPIVLALHGMGDNSSNFLNIGLNFFANRDTFIAIYPDALQDPLFGGVSTWNCGVGAFGFFVNPDVDDIGFLNAILDSTSKSYNVDTNRIYSTGFSLGGFMSQRLACELNHRVAAVASVSGTIGAGITCNPGKPVPVMHIHGTADTTISYDGLFSLPLVGQLKVGMSVDELMTHWKQNNGCQGIPVETTTPVSSFSITKIHYPSCNSSSELLHYRVDSAYHVWLGNYYTEEIWEFLRRHSLQDNTTSIDERDESQQIAIYPNPTSDMIFINPANLSIDQLIITDLTGKELYINKEVNESVTLQVPVDNLPAGFYLVHLHSGHKTFSQKIIKQE